MQRLFVFIFSFTCIISDAQPLSVDISYTTDINNPGNSLIFYKVGQQLSIPDFKGTPETGNDAVAITSSGFAFKAGFKNSNGKAVMNIGVYCNFDKNNSWMKASGKNEYILSHEQLHFDISYLSAMLFMNELKQTNFTVKNYAALLEKIYNDSVKKLEAVQQQYDEETSNGRLPVKQKEWSEKIHRQILSVKAG